MEVSNVEDLLIVGTRTGKLLVYEYFSGKMLDYQVQHNGVVKAISFDHSNKTNKLSDDIVYAFDFDDPKNRNRYLRRIYSLSDEDIVVSRYVNKLLR